jgi:transposase-like protein
VKVNGVWRYVYRAVDQYELSLDAPPMTRVAAAFTELALAI